MPYRKPSLFGLLMLCLLCGCGEAKLECDFIETRQAVLSLVSNDSRNPLANFAAKNSTENPNSKPEYLLGQKIVTTGTSKDKKTLECSGPISVIYGDLKATKEINFTVQQASGGKLSVSVVPFEF